MNVCTFAQIKTFFGPQVEQVYRSGDTTQNFYFALAPVNSIKGSVVILTVFGSAPQDILQETDRSSKTRKEEYLVIIPYLAQQTDINYYLL